MRDLRPTRRSWGLSPICCTLPRAVNHNRPGTTAKRFAPPRLWGRVHGHLYSSPKFVYFKALSNEAAAPAD